MDIRKRNGNIVPFDKAHIVNAINKAFLEVDNTIYENDTANDIADEIAYMVKCGDIYTVEEVQDTIEHYLMKSEREDVARAYIRYRYRREMARKSNEQFMKLFAQKLNGIGVENSNANMDEISFGGRVGSASDAQMKKFALDYCVSSMARENHEGNMVYIHDLSAYAVGMHNCLTIPFDKLLREGFNTRQTDVRPAGSVSTALQLVAVIFQLQSLMQFGGVSASHLDWTLVPYVRKSFFKHYKDGIKYIEGYDEIDYSFHDALSIDDSDYKAYSMKAWEYAMDMTEREVHQAVEALYHNLNTLQSRSGNQLPFTSLNYGSCTKPEGRMVIKALLEVSLEGLGKLHKTPVFPCGIFQVGEGINKRPGDPNYDLYQLALKSTAHRLYPNYANLNWSKNAGYDQDDPETYFSTMGCRTANLMDINGMGQKKDGRGNICPVTIIMPTLAMMAKERSNNYIEEFISLLDTKIHEAKDMLIERFEYICNQPAESARFMYENGTMAGYIPEEGIRSALRHGTLAMGNLGLAETLQILIGKDHTTEEGMELAKKIYQLFADRCAEFKNEYKLNFGVYNTPKFLWVA